MTGGSHNITDLVLKAPLFAVQSIRSDEPDTFSMIGLKMGHTGRKMNSIDSAQSNFCEQVYEFDDRLAQQ